MKALLAAILCFGAVADSSYDLIWHPKQGEQLRYALHVDGDGGDVQFSLSGDCILNVKKVDSSGNYRLGTAFRGMTMKAGGNTQAIPDEAEEVQDYNSRGELLSPESAPDASDVFGELLSQAADIVAPPKPVQVGQSWTVEFKSKPKVGIPASETKYTLLEVRSTDMRLKVQAEYRQIGTKSPVRANGTILVDGNDGSTLGVDSIVTGLKLDSNGPAVSARISLKLKNRQTEQGTLGS